MRQVSIRSLPNGQQRARKLLSGTSHKPVSGPRERSPMGFPDYFRIADYPPETRFLASQNPVLRSRRASLRETGYATAEMWATHGGNLILRSRSWKRGSERRSS